jgi:hypothetical protein
MLLFQLLSICSLSIVTAICFIVLGLRQLIWRKPFILSARAMFWLCVVSFSPSIFNVVWAVFMISSSNMSIILLSSLLIYIPLLYFLWKQTMGFVFFGVNDETFRHLLHQALHSANLPFEETLSRIRLTSLNMDIQAAVQSWTGMGSLSIKQARHRLTLQTIVEAIRTELAATPIAASGTGGIFYLIIGTMLFIFMAVFLGFMLSSFPSLYFSS